MPEVRLYNKFWQRGGRLDQKRSMDLSEEEKAKIATCDGIKSNHPCKNPVFRCSECGNYGCAQEVAEKCTKQGFKNDKCLHCGGVDTRIPVMADELAEFIAAWENEVEEI